MADKEVIVPKPPTESDQDMGFEFDADIPAMQRYINFKATVIGKSLPGNDGEGTKEEQKNAVMERQLKHVQAQATFAQKGVAFSSAQARRLDLAS